MEPGQVLNDENGTRHTLQRCLGKGGQGEVWLTGTGRHVVKVLTSGRRPEDLRRQLAHVKRADLKSLHVARPIALLRPPVVGYVAEFLADMAPIRGLLAPPPSRSAGEWYTSSGGLRRRLRLLAHAGEALHGLHGLGFVYGDVSHNNVFVSEPVACAEAWLIDLDNLTNLSIPGATVHTPGYGAPEIVAVRHGATSMSDAWAFAVLALHTLACVHPFLGDLVENGEPELEEQALAGGLPWIEDPEDPRNRSTRGVARAVVLSKRLRQLADETFGPGRLDRQQRPGVAKWTETLHGAADRTLGCTGCSATFYEGATECPWCSAPAPRFDRIEVRRWEPEKGLLTEAVPVAQLPLSRAPLSLPRRITHALTGLPGRVPGLSFDPVSAGVVVRAHEGDTCWITSAKDPVGKNPTELTDRGKTLPIGVLDQSYLIHCGQISSRHRVVRVGRTT